MSLIYVAATDEQAIEESRPHVEAFVNKFQKKPTPMQFPPGYVTNKSLKAILTAKMGLTQERTVESLIRDGSFLCGSPETVRRLLIERQAQLGHETQLCLLQFGSLSAELTRKNMELFATEVMPFVRDRTGAVTA